MAPARDWATGVLGSPEGETPPGYTGIYTVNLAPVLIQPLSGHDLISLHLRGVNSTRDSCARHDLSARSGSYWGAICI